MKKKAKEPKIIKTVNEDGTVTKNKEKKKIKLKNKKILIPIIILVPIFIAGIVVGLIFYNKNALSTLKKNYGEVVTITKNTALYNKNNKKIGTISKGLTLHLEEVKNLTLKNKLLSIKGSPYKISFWDIKKVKEEEKKEVEDYYLPINVHVKSNKTIELKLDDKKAMTLNGIDTDLSYMDDKNYYINIQGYFFSFPKSKDIKETTTKDVIDGAVSSIPVIYYERIEDGCEDDVCLKTASVKIHIKKLKDEGYYFITKNDFVLFMNGYRNLKEKAVILTTNEENDAVKNIKEELGVEIGVFNDSDSIKFQTTNKVATRDDSKDQVNRYQAKRYTLIDDYSRMAHGEEVSDNGWQTDWNQGIAVINYHFFYDASKGEECNESICLEVSKLREQFQWLNDNGYKTLTIHEYADWMDGLIEVPRKSVLLTIDDGAMGTSDENGNILMPTLEEYKIHATLFLITGWWDISHYQSPYLDVQSHSHYLHEEMSCADGRGTLACSDYETVKQDISASLDQTGDRTSFCFPFYSYDNESLQAISELGIRDAFIGGSIKSKRSNDHLLIPRYPILDDISLYSFINMVE